MDPKHDPLKQTPDRVLDEEVDEAGEPPWISHAAEREAEGDSKEVPNQEGCGD